MTQSPLPDHALDALLRAHAPTPLADDDFVARTLAAIDRAAPLRRAAAVPSPRQIAHALAAERRRGELLARQRRWGLAGVAAGGLLLVLAVLAAPTGAATAASANVLFTLWLALLSGAGWLGWQALRSA